MREFSNESIDLIYLDPPYYTNRNFKNNNYKFSDKWKNIDAYLEFMEVRLTETHRILRSTGSIYLQADWRVIFDLKPIMDSIFGRDNFKNDIVWSYNSGGSSKKTKFAKKHDTILFYTKSDTSTFNTQRIPYECGISKKHKHNFHKDGKRMGDSWNDIHTLSTTARERTGYPTQKPIALLDRIITVSSNLGDIVLDPFCGSGTALKSAQNLGRQYIGIDENIYAVEVSNKRLRHGLSNFY